jgi:hypothetical protein
MNPKRKSALPTWAEMKPAIRQRIRLIASERNLLNNQIANALTCKDEPLLQFADRHSLSAALLSGQR